MNTRNGLTEVHARERDERGLRPTWRDRAVGFISPTLMVRRLEARMQSEFMLSSYNSVANTRRNPLSGSAGTGDYHIGITNLWTMREKVRELERNNCILRGILRRLIDNIIQQGIHVQATTKDKDWNREAEYRFSEWATDRTQCDIEQRLEFWQQQRLVYRSTRRDGDMLVMFVNDGNNRATLQLLEADRIASPRSTNEADVINGVRVNADGKPMEYYVTDQATTSSYAYGTGDWKNAENCLLVMNERDRQSQTRGIPAFASELNILEDIDNILEAELFAFKVNACFAFFWGRDHHLMPTYDTKAQPDDYGGSDYLHRISPGQIVYGKPTDLVNAIDSKRPGPQFYEGLKAFFRILGLNHGLPLQFTLLDFSDTSFSSHRGALLEARRGFETEQKLMGSEFVKPVYLRKIKEFIDWAGLGYPKTDRPEEDWKQCRLQYPAWPWVDPEAEAKANTEALMSGQKTYMDIAEQMGTFWEDLVDQRVREIAYAKEAAITAGIDPELVMPPKRAAPPGIQPQTNMPEEPEQEEEDNAVANAE